MSTGWEHLLSVPVMPARGPAELPYVRDGDRLDRPLLLDSDVYIHDLQGKLPQVVRDLIARSRILHSAVARGELLLGIAGLDPAHPRTATVRTALEKAIGKMDEWRIAAPGTTAWDRATVLAGVLARHFRLQKDERRRLLNDALIFATAEERRAAVLTGNRRDFDRLSRLLPHVVALFYAPIAMPPRRPPDNRGQG